ncbi:MAG: TIGR00730 family Rossman fold protein [Actinomycetota bacterium]|jgi:uncharacterized protein (TIGR00730 family)|nr:TIGR00730 family Rossman fold protein [Actinomycetota bacterium]
MRSLCVFCGSNPGRQPVYMDAVRSLATVLAEEEIRIVYGGAHVGTMGALADTALEAGGEVIGVIPEQQVGEEVAHTGLTELHVVGSMHERKALMAELSDGFIALPGGLGTLEEFAEVVTWSQLGLHRKPTGLLNTAGYYDSLLGFLDHAVVERFLRAEDRALVLAETEVRPLLRLMRAWAPNQQRGWKPAEDQDAVDRADATPTANHPAARKY